MRPFRLRSLPLQAFRTIGPSRLPHVRFTSTARLNGAAALAQSSTDHYTPPPPLSTPSAADDSLLKAHFDTPTAAFSPFGEYQPLFLYPPLTHPKSLRPLTDRTLIQSQAIVDRICAAKDDPTGKELRLVVKNLDRLSDVLCGVIDMCELVRNVHPEEEWIAECESSYERLCSFMNGLNTHTGLYEVSLLCECH